MTKPRRIYLLSPRDLSPETIAVAFAKTSRSPEAFDVIAAELTDARAAKFHEKWVVGYGHASVAEHAVLHLALENVSRLAIETIEGNRLASYTEKSTRYQQWDVDAFYFPEELKGQPLEEKFSQTCHNLFETYQLCISRVQDWLRKTTPQSPEESDVTYERRIKPASVDICRFLLPAASLANVGVTINARSLEYAICKMLSSPLDEVRQIGEWVLKVGKAEAPTLIKYAGCNAYLIKTTEKMSLQAEKVQPVPSCDFTLVDYDDDGEEKILAAILFRFSPEASFEACQSYIRQLDNSGRQALVQELMAERGPFDQPIREFEYAQMTFEAVMDQGAYFEFKRHRMMTQTVQPLTALLGYAVPRGIIEAGCEVAYREAMDQAESLYNELWAFNTDLAGYIIPNGFNRRVLFTLNMREAFTLCRLRAAENAHFSIRRVALKMIEAISGIYPSLASFMTIPDGVAWQDIDKDYF
ncbi:FAD-dependent thymidylate synthase [Chloroflexota bacterium]|nr:FAD-dependent thymidylate synthase [Chloroflexota bacterium]